MVRTDSTFLRIREGLCYSCDVGNGKHEQFDAADEPYSLALRGSTSVNQLRKRIPRAIISAASASQFASQATGSRADSRLTSSASKYTLYT